MAALSQTAVMRAVMYLVAMRGGEME